MLINLSNHPSSRWSEAQQQAANDQYGDIKDIPFPQIPPEATYLEVEALVGSYFLNIKDYAKEETVTVHLMGEMTFTYMLVNQLKGVGIPCIASTTNRTVTEKDNKKIVTFSFIQFRSYF